MEANKKIEQITNKRTAILNTCSWKSIVTELCMLAIIAGFAFWVNRDIVIKGLYMDDLYMWSCYGEQSIWEFAFPIGTSTRFRPVYWLATYLQMAVIGTHINRFVAFNIIINIFVAFELFYMAKRLSGGIRLTGFITAVCYLASRFAYYQIGQALGLMETMALSMSILVWYLLLKACGLIPGNANASAGEAAGDSMTATAYDGGRLDLRAYMWALAVYLLLVFVHERYISLLPLFYLSLIINLLKGKCLKGQTSSASEKGKRAVFISWIMPVLVLGIIIAIRKLAIGKALPAGTGGTEVTDTFSIVQSLRFCLDQVLYILGVNAGPEYLCGLSWSDTPWQIKRAIKISILLIGLLCIIFAFSLIRRFVKELRTKLSKETYDEISFCVMLCSFAALCIGCSSVTIRLEMRWIYVSYAAALLFAAYMAGRLKSNEKVLALMLFTAYAIISVYTNIFYRGYFNNIYFWANQLRMNSLAEETIEKYGTEGVLGKKIYIIENSYEMTDFYAETFFKTYDRDKRAEGTEIIFADSITDIPAEEIREDKALVLIELPEENAYRDITDDLK